MNLNESKATIQRVALLLAPVILLGCAAEDKAIPITKPRAEIQSEIYVSRTEKKGAPYDHIYSYGDFLFATAKDQGVQVIDNTDPFSPKHEMFLNIPGAKDVVIDGDSFITNQYADLVVFSISQQREISRINNLYNYKDYIEIPAFTSWKDREISEDQVVVDFRIEESKDACFLFC